MMKSRFLHKPNLILIFTSFLLLLLIYFFYKSRRETYCNKIPSTNAFGAENTTAVDLTYPPQDGVSNNNCDKYWKEFPNEQNTDFLEDIPLDRNMAYNKAPFTAEKSTRGLIDYSQLISLINDSNAPFPEEIESEYDESLKDPLNGSPIDYEFELKYDLSALNKRTWIHRAKEFNPTQKNKLPYDKISSPIEDVNRLNEILIKRINEKQTQLLSPIDLITFGKTNFYIYKYMIQSIRYHKRDPSRKVYTIKVVIFRENDVFTPTIFYQGYVYKNEYRIYNATYIGANESSQYLMNESAGLRASSQKYYMLNDNYRHDDPEYARSVDKEVAQRKEYMKQFDLKEAYACFNTDFNVYLNPTTKSNIILPYLSRQQCEAPFDFYGRVKPKGIFDKPCKSDSECPYFGKNKNYPNKRGKCLANGQCELPVNMIPIGYHYYVPHPEYKPMCYNCGNSSGWRASTKLDTCCDDQKDPDYAFEGDIEERANHENQLHTRVYPNQQNKIKVIKK